jgi:hypothetical protein
MRFGGITGWIYDGPADAFWDPILVGLGRSLRVLTEHRSTYPPGALKLVLKCSTSKDPRFAGGTIPAEMALFGRISIQHYKPDSFQVVTKPEEQKTRVRDMEDIVRKYLADSARGHGVKDHFKWLSPDEVLTCPACGLRDGFA